MAVNCVYRFLDKSLNIIYKNFLLHLYNSINMYKESFYCNEIAFLLHEMHEFVNELHENNFI